MFHTHKGTRIDSAPLQDKQNHEGPIENCLPTWQHITFIFIKFHYKVAILSNIKISSIQVKNDVEPDFIRWHIRHSCCVAILSQTQWQYTFTTISHLLQSEIGAWSTDMGPPMQILQNCDQGLSWDCGLICSSMRGEDASSLTLVVRRSQFLAIVGFSFLLAVG